MSPSKMKNLEVLCAQIDKKYGKGSVMKLTDTVSFEPDQVINSGSIKLDMALGIGGYKKGRIVEIFGPESSGKTTLCLHAVANTQKQSKHCVYIDAEHALDAQYAQALGVNLDEMIISQPDYGEQALDIVDMFVRSGDVGLIVVDSVAALVPKKELEGDIGDSSIGVQARMMSQAMRKFAGVCNKTGTSVIFVNQIRHKIGVMFGSPETTSGGNALKFYASQRLDIRRTGDLKRGDKIIGNKTKVRIIKNKLAPPKQIVEFNIMFGKGIDTDQELLELAIMDSILVKKGAWYKYNDEVIAQGEPNALIWMNEHPNIKKEIMDEVRMNRGIDVDSSSEITTEDTENTDTFQVSESETDNDKE